MPSPTTSASRIAHASPVPAHTTLGFDGATASAPMACTSALSNTGTNRCPPSVDFHTPPDAEPTYHTAVSPGTPVIEAMRPPPAGPRSSKPTGDAFTVGLGCGTPPRGALAIAATSGRTVHADASRPKRLYRIREIRR